MAPACPRVGRREASAPRGARWPDWRDHLPPPPRSVHSVLPQALPAFVCCSRTDRQPATSERSPTPASGMHAITSRRGTSTTAVGKPALLAHPTRKNCPYLRQLPCKPATCNEGVGGQSHSAGSLRMPGIPTLPIDERVDPLAHGAQDLLARRHRLGRLLSTLDVKGLRDASAERPGRAFGPDSHDENASALCVGCHPGQVTRRPSPCRHQPRTEPATPRAPLRARAPAAP